MEAAKEAETLENDQEEKSQQDEEPDEPVFDVDIAPEETVLDLCEKKKKFAQKRKEIDDDSLPISIRAALKAQRLVDLPKRPFSRQQSRPDEVEMAEASR